MCVVGDSRGRATPRHRALCSPTSPRPGTEGKNDSITHGIAKFFDQPSAVRYNRRKRDESPESCYGIETTFNLRVFTTLQLRSAKPTPYELCFCCVTAKARSMKLLRLRSDELSLILTTISLPIRETRGRAEPWHGETNSDDVHRI